jgi:hypothetical protein
MRSSCVKQKENDKLAIIRASYVQLCDGDMCAAVLLNNFVFWNDTRAHNSELEYHHRDMDSGYQPCVSQWVYKSFDDLADSTLRLYGRMAVIEAIKHLKAMGLLEVENQFSDSGYKWNNRYRLLVSELNQRIESLSTTSTKGSPKMDDQEQVVQKWTPGSPKMDDNKEENKGSRINMLASPPISETQTLSSSDRKELETESQTHVPPRLTSERLNSDVISAEISAEDVEFDDFIKLWHWRYKLKKPNKSVQDKLRLKWEHIHCDSERLSYALGEFTRSDWAKENDYPIHAFVAILVKDGYQTTKKTAPIAPASQEVPRKPSPRATTVAETAQRIHDRHIGRKCNVAVVIEKLEIILEKSPGVTLSEVERKHDGWCKSEDWNKEQRRYAPKLSNYLEHGRDDQWDNEPPLDEEDMHSQGYYTEADAEAHFRKVHVEAGGDGANFDRLLASQKARNAMTYMSETWYENAVKIERWEQERGIDFWSRKPIPGWIKPVVQ